MNVVQAAILGVVQGLTEFLPVSSSAHLVLARAFFGFDADAFGVAFDVACHVGTLLAVLLFFRRDLAAMLRALPRAIAMSADPDARRVRLIVIGTVPIVVVGLLWADLLEGASVRTPVVAATALAAGALLLFWVERMGPRKGGDEHLSWGGALAIGVAQSAALVPGVSRSGATIATGMWLGLDRAAAARFTFLLSVPAIVAAAAKKGLELRTTGLSGDAATLFAVGLLTSAVVGYLTIRFFMRFLVSHRLDVFAWYRVALSAATFGWLLAR